MNEEKVKSELLNQIKQYLSGHISIDEYYEMAERCYSLYANYIIETDFHDIFFPAIPDLLMYYIDEPGIPDEMREPIFKAEIKKIYEKLLLL